LTLVPKSLFLLIFNFIFFILSLKPLGFYFSP